MQQKEIIARLSKEIKTSTKSLGIYSFIALILFAILVWCIVSMVDIIQFWYVQRKSFRETATARSTNKPNNPSNPAHDNYAYINQSDMMAENNDDYQRYTDQINKSVAEFKEYNEKLKAFYEANKPGQSPKDLIDEKIVTKSDDNY